MRDLARQHIFAVVGKNARGEPAFFMLDGTEIGRRASIGEGGMPNLPGAFMRIPKSMLSEQNHYRIKVNVYTPNTSVHTQNIGRLAWTQAYIYPEQAAGTTAHAEFRIGGEEQ